MVSYQGLDTESKM